MARPLAGRLEPPTTGRKNYSCRLRVSGKHRRFDLGTADPVLASKERDRIIASVQEGRQDIGANGRSRLSVKQVRKTITVGKKESRLFPAIAERYWQQLEADGVVRTWKGRKSMLEQYVLPTWTADVSRYTAQSVRDLMVGLPMAYQTKLNLFSALTGVFDSAVLAGLIEANPCKQVKRSKLVSRRKDEAPPKVRATLVPDEVLAMCSWKHPQEQHQESTRQLQDKLLIAYFLGLRHHEIVSLRFDDFEDVVTESKEKGKGFSRLVVFRAKKRDPAKQRDTLDISALPVLQECFQRRWVEQGKPSTGFVFPALRDGDHAEAGKDQAAGVTEASHIRRLYRRAMGIEQAFDEQRTFADKRCATGKRESWFVVWKEVRPLSDREKEVLEGNDRVARVTFHAGRHAFAKACEDSGLADEQTRDLLDHENVKVTQGYQRRLGGRAKHVPNVHKGLSEHISRAREPSSPPESDDPDGNECDLPGNIERVTGPISDVFLGEFSAPGASRTRDLRFRKPHAVEANRRPKCDSCQVTTRAQDVDHQLGGPVRKDE